MTKKDGAAMGDMRSFVAISNWLCVSYGYGIPTQGWCHVRYHGEFLSRREVHFDITLPRYRKALLQHEPVRQ